MLGDMLKRRIEFQHRDGEDYLNVVQNARVIADAEQYYRIMYYGGAASWNLRDRHMFDTLLSLLSFHGPESKAVIWAHNSHVGDASATEMSARGEFNIGELCRREFGDKAFAVGFGTHCGTVAAATEWGGEMELKTIRPSHPESYERLCHNSGGHAFFLHLREPDRPELRDELMTPRLGRAIGVIYRPETEIQSHYFQAVLPLQFDEYVWFDETGPVHPFDHPQIHGIPDTFPSGL
jgi:protein-L-isoaspartate(D-aspartate) O-methyltransferase